MRISLANSLVLTAMLFAAGCSAPSRQSMKEYFSFKKKPAASSSSLSAAPSPFGPSATTTSPSVSMGTSQQVATNMPVYPGTPYPVTPYPATVVATTATTPVYPAAAQASSAPAGGYMPQGNAAPPSQPANTYAGPSQSYAAPPTQPYASPAIQPYDPAAPNGQYNAATTQPGAYTR